ncbi:ATP phosphoribosyltransferase regulatory subunit [Hahella aquimaris]|uniref:ATP phosphoribosyltransferase regulatory subunit n=1 Tax=Hahella sp. HNIBRBA332 TaxID=3015983 RepID=UPI00273A998C|nr:ATP phosphoribosyltransferase regulatory subunit [Hahella sp. HNIBRBA332]WLQ12153.1 ATP phosphoribosyltransferase regulatory subunit [Hahella sp. HNIBRBA332]
MEYKIEGMAKGVRIISGETAKKRRALLNQMITLAEASGFEEVILPSIEPSQVYVDKAGEEILGQMYVFPDKKGRSLCLRPEGTATVQLVADKHFKRRKNVRLWYFERCWRYEQPQEGRYREFFQFGVEVINPSTPTVRQELIDLAEKMVSLQTPEYEVFSAVKRGLSYYMEDGFEISVPKLGAQKQVVGGGAYKQGIGFGIGFDRLMLC